jgi:CheY-like chemotaxis protein
VEPRANRRVVVIDDDPAVREGLGALLELHGWQVESFDDGGAALAHLRRSEPPAVILLDLVMPRLDGALFRKRQLADPTLSRIPVVVITAAPQLEGTTEAVGLPVLSKPLEPRRLLDLLDGFAPPRR